MRSNLENVIARFFTMGQGLTFQQTVMTLGAAVTLGADQNPLLFLDPGGATRVVTLPAARKGGVFLIVNTADAAEDLTINNAAAQTRGTISQNEAGLVVSDGTAWYVVLVGTST